VTAAEFKENKKQKSSPATRRVRKQKSLIKQFKRLIPNTATPPLPKPPTPKLAPSILPKIPGPGGLFVLEAAFELIFPEPVADATLDNAPEDAKPFDFSPFMPNEAAPSYITEGEPPFKGGQGLGVMYTVTFDLYYTEQGSNQREKTKYHYVFRRTDSGYMGPLQSIEPYDPGDTYNDEIIDYAVRADRYTCEEIHHDYAGIKVLCAGNYEINFLESCSPADYRYVKNNGYTTADYVITEVVSVDREDGEPDTDGDPQGELKTYTPEAPERQKVDKSFQPSDPETAPKPTSEPKDLVSPLISSKQESERAAGNPLPDSAPAEGTSPFEQPSAETLASSGLERASQPAGQTGKTTVSTDTIPEQATTTTTAIPSPSAGTVATGLTAAGTSAKNSRLPSSSAFEEPKSPPTTNPPDPCRSPDRCSSKGLDLLDDLLDLVSLIRDNNCCDEILSILKGEYNGLNYTEYCATDENGEKSYKSEAIKYETEGLQSAMQLLQTSVTGEIEKLKRKLLCEELESNVVFPSGWNIRPEYWRPQLVIKFRGKSENGKLTNSWWSITVPHYNGQTRPQTSPIQEYRRGSVEGILTLNDNSKVTVHCASEGQALYILEGIRAYIDPKQTDGSYIKTGMIRSQSPIKTVNVVPWDAKYYSQGAKGQNPDWVAYFAPT